MSCFYFTRTTSVGEGGGVGGAGIYVIGNYSTAMQNLTYCGRNCRDILSVDLTAGNKCMLHVNNFQAVHRCAYNSPCLAIVMCRSHRAYGRLRPL